MMLELSSEFLHQWHAIQGDFYGQSMNLVRAWALKIFYKLFLRINPNIISFSLVLRISLGALRLVPLGSRSRELVH